jgi:hypothetical protein
MPIAVHILVYPEFELLDAMAVETPIPLPPRRSEIAEGDHDALTYAVMFGTATGPVSKRCPAAAPDRSLAPPRLIRGESERADRTL